MTTNVIFVAGIADDLGGTKDTTAGRFDSAYADQCISFGNGISGRAVFSKVPTGKLHIHMKLFAGPSMSSVNSDGFWMQARDAVDGTLTWGLDLTNGDIVLVTYGTGGSTTPSWWSMANSTLYDIDITEEVVAGTRTVELWVNGALQLSNSSTATERTRVLDLIHSDYTTSPANCYSEFYATENNQSTIGTRLAKLPGNAVGNYTDGIGSYTDLDEVGVSGLALAAAEKYSYNLASLGVSPTTISDVVANVRALPGAGGPTQVNPFVRISATVSAVSLPFCCSPILVGWDQNPNTVGAWTEAAVNALEFGIEAVA